MKLKLDENLNERGRALLAAAGHDVSTVPLQGLQAETDEVVIQACREEGRALVTLDLDFANPRQCCGEVDRLASLRARGTRWLRAQSGMTAARACPRPS